MDNYGRNYVNPQDLIDPDYQLDPDAQFIVDEADRKLSKEKYFNLGLIAKCEICGSEIEGLPPGAILVGGCDKCKQEIEANKNAIDAGLPNFDDVAMNSGPKHQLGLNLPDNPDE